MLEIVNLETGNTDPTPIPQHEGPVSCVDMRADGTLCTGGYDGAVGIWSPAGRAEAWLRGHAALVNAVAFDRDGRRVASASSDHTAIVWDLTNGRAVQRFTGHSDDVNSVAWSPDGDRIVTGAFDGTAQVFEVASGDRLATLRGHQGDVNGVAWSPRGDCIATASDDRTARLWTPEGALLHELRGHTDWVDAVAFSPDGRLVATASLDRSARVFDVACGREVAHLAGHGCTVKAVRFSPDGALLATAAYDKRIRVFEVGSFAPVGELVDARMWNRSLAWGRAGRIATGSFGRTPVQWRLGESRARTRDLIGSPGINGMALSPCGRRAALACDDGAARIVCLSTGRVLRERFDHEGAVLSTAWSRDGSRVAYGGWDDHVSIHDAASGTLLAWIDGTGDPINALAFSEDDRELALGSFMGTLSVWCARSGERLRVAGAHEGSIKSVVALPGGRGWVTGGRDGVVRVHTDRETRELRIGSTIVNGVAVSPDACLLGAATRGLGVVVVDPGSGRRIAEYRVPSASARTLAFSPDGAWLAAGHYDGSLLVARTGAHEASVSRPFGATALSNVAFTPDGRGLVVATWDPRGRFGRIDLESGELSTIHALQGGAA